MLFSCLIAFLLILSSFASVSAIVGRLGNSRMVLYLNPGETAERYLSVENANDIPLTISLTVSGGLADNLVLKEKNFSLEPGESRKVYFTVEAKETTITETKINVMFTPPEGTGVGLTATVVVMPPNEENNDSESPDAPKFKFSSTLLLLISSIIFLILFIALIAYSNKKRVKKRARRPSEQKS